LKNDTETNKMNNSHARLIVLTFAAAALAACSAGSGGSAPTAVPTPAPAPALAVSVATDKASYSPGQAVLLKVGMKNLGSSAIAGAKVVLTVRHLAQVVGPAIETVLALPAGAAAALELSWTAPAADFQGYSVEVAVLDAAGKVLASDTGAIDVSSSWLKFPRYGYLSQFGAGLDATAVIDQLKAYHINALQFYDWQWKHHVPLKGTPSAPDATWHDIANRATSGDTIRKLIGAAHRAGMAAMQYNLIYGAAVHYQQDGVSPSWGLYDTKGGKQWQYDLPGNWTTSAIYFFNPADPRWQDYILDREMEVFQAFQFDGWHADTVGDNGIKYDALNNPVDIKDTFKPFLNAAKARLGSKLLMMNAVGNKGHEQVNTSKVDAVYVEVWPWEGTPDYRSLKGLVDQARMESGGKSLIMPAYMNYDYGKSKSNEAPGLFNDPGVILTEATVLAAGGSRLELGDDTRMLCHEYFPNRSLAMSAALKTAMRHYYDFAVAYENLLRDGQAATQKTVTIDGAAVSADGAPNAVWAFTKQDARYETVNLINLVGVADVSWRDTNANRNKPAVLRSFKLKYYTDARMGQAYLASPDSEGGRSRSLPMEAGIDAKGAFVAVTVPSLEYWNLIYFKKSI
jgi:dextranase